MSSGDTIYGPAIPGDFNDPEMWGYCKYCAFEVARDAQDNVLFKHSHMDASWVKRPCCGGGKPPSQAPGLEAEPVAPPPPTFEEVITDALDEDEDTGDE